MAIKEKHEDIDVETAFADIPLFATVEEAIEDIHIEDSQIKIQVIKQDDKDE